MATERTLSIIKPDATRRNLTGRINACLEEAGLRIVAQRRIRTAAEHIIDPEHIGQKKPVEPPALQRPGQVDPVRQPVITGGAVARMGP